MIKLRRILFPTDFSRCAEQAYEHAFYLAKQYQAELHVLHAVVLHGFYNQPEFGLADVNELEDRLEEAARRQMSSSLNSNLTDQVKIIQARRRGLSVAPVILEYARTQDIDLIILGTHGRRGLGHLLLGSVAEEIVRLSPCPVFTVRERQVPQPIEDLDRILVPIDFSEHSKHALRYAKQIAASYDACLQLLHIIERVTCPSFYALEKHLDRELLPVQQKAKEALERFLEETEGPELTAECHVIEGRASSDITECSKDLDSDLVVIATHGLTGIEHLLLGSVTEKVVRRSSCPVFTVTVYGKNLIWDGHASHHRTSREEVDVGHSGIQMR
jgi:nucleotide-binding universal stress UspA family protein